MCPLLKKTIREDQKESKEDREKIVDLSPLGLRVNVERVFLKLIEVI